MLEDEASVSLVDLPDPCLLAVLRCCAADDRVSLCNAARSHSRLHQAAVAALSTVKIHMPDRGTVDSALHYLSKHGGDVHNIDFNTYGVEVTLRQLPSSLQQLTSLKLSSLQLQLQPGEGFQGVLGPVVKKEPLKQLQLYSCKLLDGAVALAAALLLLPGLEHLSLRSLKSRAREDDLCFSSEMLQMPNLTYLDLSGIALHSSQDVLDLHPLQGLTRLVDLRLAYYGGRLGSGRCSVTAAVLSNVNCLTRLQLHDVACEPAALVGKAKLQHLTIRQYAGNLVPETPAEGLQLLSQLQQLTVLTSLDLTGVLHATEATPPPAAFSALTTSSQLQHFALGHGTLPAGVWKHIFPVGRQLPHLRELHLSCIEQAPAQPSLRWAPGPEGSHLVSCCPSLHEVELCGLECSTEMLGALTGLSRLQFDIHDCTAGWAGLEAVAKLTGMRDLTVIFNNMDGSTEVSLLHLTQLKQLTSLSVAFRGLVTAENSSLDGFFMEAQAPDDEPVWRQLLKRHLDREDQQLAPQAVATLAV